MTSDNIAFFDFDGTLTRSDTFLLFTKFAVGRMKFAFALARSLPILCAWKFGVKSSSQAKQYLFSALFGGMDYEVFRRKGEEFVCTIDRQLRPEILDILRDHQRVGHRTVIVSASVGDWIRPWADRNGIDDVIATEAETDSLGRLTGRFSTPNCLGEEKVRRIREQFGDFSGETWGYGDSRSDKPMLRLTDHLHKV